MYYKIKKDKRTGKFVVTRQKYRDDRFRFEVDTNRVLQFDSALLVLYDNQKYSLFLTSSTEPNEPTFIVAGISQYCVFRNSAGRQNCILALQIYDFWTFLVPEDFRYFIDTEKIRIGRTAKLPKIFITDDALPAYFKEGFEDTLIFIFHANGKDYLVDPKNFDMTGTAAQIGITEFVEVTPLPPKGYFKAIDEKGEYLFKHSYSYGPYAKVEEFAEDDYPEEFKVCYGYWGKNADGNILTLHITDANGNCTCHIKFYDRPAKSVHFYSRTYTDTVNKYYYDIWQVIYADGHKQLKIEETGDVDNPVADEDAWNF